MEEEAKEEVEVKEVKKDKTCSYCRIRGHQAKEFYKKQNAEKKRANKGKGAAVNQSNSNKGNNASKNNSTFPDQEKARFAEYMSRTFAVFSDNPNGPSSAINNPVLYPQGF